MYAPDDFSALVRASRTFRRFDEGQPIARDELVSLIETARFAPCGNNLQVLRYRLITEPSEVETCLAHHRWAGLILDWVGPEAGERPVAYVAILAPAGQRKSALRNQDAGIAAQTIMLAARTRGLGGCMVGSFDAAFDAALGIDQQGYETLILLALGYPTEEVVLEEAPADGSVAYWHDERGCNHVPKRAAADLII